MVTCELSNKIVVFAHHLLIMNQFYKENLADQAQGWYFGSSLSLHL